MKKVFLVLFVFCLTVSLSLFQSAPVRAQEESSLGVEVGVICLDVVDREPVGIDESFESSVGTLFCFTKVVGAEEPVEVTHVWYWKEKERARVTLPVESKSWRTWSSKRIQEHEVGPWHVDVLGPDGQLIEIIEFVITE